MFNIIFKFTLDKTFVDIKTKLGQYKLFILINLIHY